MQFFGGSVYSPNPLSYATDGTSSFEYYSCNVRPSSTTSFAVNLIARAFDCKACSNHLHVQHGYEFHSFCKSKYRRKTRLSKK